MLFFSRTTDSEPAKTYGVTDWEEARKKAPLEGLAPGRGVDSPKLDSVPDDLGILTQKKKVEIENMSPENPKQGETRRKCRTSCILTLVQIKSLLTLLTLIIVLLVEMCFICIDLTVLNPTANRKFCI